MFPRTLRHWVLGGFALSLLLMLSSGCAHTFPDESESTLPWNMPESWEGVPYMPGLEQ
ncbi:MAG: hypothetical protein H7A43_04615 [Verrucomicrobia bacterium]|nr:hypothetical protein [Kiritimatiellia bacterium]MCB1102794.1 hypothetical protein [Kiritimatiellia bacterium]MCP5487912.1 hypothetical protein [Verrucomicrobiota bacterium]